jgi:hypothetical protein
MTLESEVVGQLAGCRDAVDHVVDGANPAGSESRLAASMPATIGFAFLLLSIKSICVLKMGCISKAAKKQ